MVNLISWPDCTIVELGARYDSLDVDSLEEAGGVLLIQAATVKPPRIVVDFSATTFIGSTLIELLIRTWRRLDQRGGDMVLCGLTPFCAEVLHVTQLDTLWRSFPTRDEAAEAVVRG